MAKSKGREKSAGANPLELAMAMVKGKGAAVPTRELLEAVVEAMRPKPKDKVAEMARLHTALCLDSRLQSYKGGWILREWAPKPRAPRGAALKGATVPVPKHRRAESRAEPGREEAEAQGAADGQEEKEEGGWD